YGADLRRRRACRPSPDRRRSRCRIGARRGARRRGGRGASSFDSFLLQELAEIVVDRPAAQDALKLALPVLVVLDAREVDVPTIVAFQLVRQLLLFVYA